MFLQNFNIRDNFLFSQTPKQEDPATIKKRRERNKIAAMKCRRRKRERIMKLQKVGVCFAHKKVKEKKKKKTTPVDIFCFCQITWQFLCNSIPCTWICTQKLWKHKAGIPHGNITHLGSPREIFFLRFWWGETPKRSNCCSSILEHPDKWWDVTC